MVETREVVASPLGQRPRVLERAVQHPDAADATSMQMLHRESGHPAGADHDHVTVAEIAELLLCQVGPERNERVGCSAERGFGARPSARPRGRMEQGAHRGA